MAIEQSMLGAAHACSNPLTAQLSVPHGIAVGLMLPAVVRHNAELPSCRATFATIARDSSLSAPGTDDEQATLGLVSFLERLAARAAGSLSALEESNLESCDRGRLATLAAGEWTGGFNPRELSAPGYRTLYDGALSRFASGGAP